MNDLEKIGLRIAACWQALVEYLQSQNEAEWALIEGQARDSTSRDPQSDPEP